MRVFADSQDVFTVLPGREEVLRTAPRTASTLGTPEGFYALQDSVLEAAEVEACEEVPLSGGGEGTRVRLTFDEAGRRATGLASATFIIDTETDFLSDLWPCTRKGGQWRLLSSAS